MDINGYNEEDLAIVPRDLDTTYRYVWDNDKLNIFRANLSSDESRHEKDYICNNLLHDRDDVNRAVKSFVTVIERCAQPMRAAIRPISARNSRSAPPWWNNECQTKKIFFQQAWKTYKHNRSDEHYRLYQTSRRIYRNNCRFHRKRYNKDMMCLHMQNQPKLF